MRWTHAIGLAAALACGAHAVEPSTRPTAPASPYADPAAYDAAAAKAIDDFGRVFTLSLASWSRLPATGMTLVDVEPDAALAAAGVEVGDILVALAGVPTRTRSELDAAQALADEAPVTATLWSAQGRVAYTIAWPEGGLRGGNRAVGGLVPHGFYANGLARDLPLDASERPAWDEPVRVALGSIVADPPLATEAIRRAEAAGAAGPFFHTLAAEVAEQDGRLEDALGFARRALADNALADAPGVRVRAAYTATHAAILLGDFAYARDIAGLRPPGDEATDPQLGEIEEAIRIVEAARGPIRSACDLADERGTIDRTAEVQGVGSSGRDNYVAHRLVHHVEKHGGWSFDVPAGHYQYYKHGPGLRDFDLSLDVRFEANVPISPRWGHVFALGIFRVDDPDQQKLLAKLPLYHDGRFAPDLFGLPEAAARVPALRDATRPHRVRLCVVGPNIELQIDGRPHLRSPLPPSMIDDDDRQLGFYLQTVGIKGRVTDLRWAEVKPPA